MLSKLKSGQKNLETTEAELMTLTMGGADIANGHTAIDGVEQVNIAQLPYDSLNCLF